MRIKRRKAIMRIIKAIVSSLITNAVCWKAFSALSREWGTGFVKSNGLKGYILTSIVLVAVGSIIWILPERYLRTKAGLVATTLFGGGTIGGMATGFAFFTAEHGYASEVLCGFAVSLISYVEMRQFWNTLKQQRESENRKPSTADPQEAG